MPEMDDDDDLMPGLPLDKVLGIRECIRAGLTEDVFVRVLMQSLEDRYDAGRLEGDDAVMLPLLFGDDDAAAVERRKELEEFYRALFEMIADWAQ